jgi:hypothetical protein
MPLNISLKNRRGDGASVEYIAPFDIRPTRSLPVFLASPQPSQCPRESFALSPEGTSESSPGRQSWVNRLRKGPVPSGTAEHQGLVFSRPRRGLTSFVAGTQDYVLGYSQPVPTGLNWQSTSDYNPCHPSPTADLPYGAKVLRTGFVNQPMCWTGDDESQYSRLDPGEFQCRY